MTLYLSSESWIQEGVRRFGKNKMNWRFKCTACGTVQSSMDCYRRGQPAYSALTKCLECNHDVAPDDAGVDAITNNDVSTPAFPFDDT